MACTQIIRALPILEMAYGFYPFLAIGSLLLELAALAFWLFAALPPGLIEAIGAAEIFSVGVMVTTAVAAPLMLRVGKTDAA